MKRMRPVWLAVAVLVLGGAVGMAQEQAIDVVAKKAAEPPVIDGKVDKVWGTVEAVRVTLKEGKQGHVELRARALYTDSHVFFLFQWPDKTESLNRFYELVGGEWKKAKGEEDRLSLLWDIGGSVKDFPKMGCTAVCHKEDKTVTFGTTALGQKLDLWNWTAQRSNPLGYMDDLVMFHEARGNRPARRADGGGGYEDNWDKDAKRPRFSFKEGATLGPVLLKADAVEIKDAGKFKAGDRLPREVLEKPVGGRGDIEAKAAWDNDRWTLEVRRARVTKDEGDVQLSGSGPFLFGISVHDNGEKDEHAHTDKTVLRLLLK